MYRFIDHNIRPSFPTHEELWTVLSKDQLTVIILRPTLFFYATQEITVNKLREYFTDLAITKLVGDGFIKFKENE